MASATSTVELGRVSDRPESFLGSFWHSLSRQRLGLAGAGVVLIFVLIAIFAPLLAPYDPTDQDLSKRFNPPSVEHLLGNDELGRDILSRIIWGTRTSLVIAGVSVIAALSGGIPLGLIAGYYSGYLDNLIMRLVDILMAFPSILLALTVIAVLGVGIDKLIVAVAIYSLPTYVRLVRGSALNIRNQEYILAARAIGARDLRIMRLHLLPNLVGPIVVQASLNVATVILTASALSFLGLGVQPPTPEWGAMMSTARAYMRVAPHTIMFPGLSLMLVVLGLNVFGDALRDILDPALQD